MYRQESFPGFDWLAILGTGSTMFPKVKSGSMNSSMPGYLGIQVGEVHFPGGGALPCSLYSTWDLRTIHMHGYLYGYLNFIFSFTTGGRRKESRSLL